MIQIFMNCRFFRMGCYPGGYLQISYTETEKKFSLAKRCYGLGLIRAKLEYNRSEWIFAGS